MTPQEIFDFVVRHLIQQGRQAVGVDGSCRYRASHWRKCAIGCLIPDNKYTPGMEGLPIDGLLGEFPTIPDFFALNSDLLFSLQAAHDSSESWDDSGLSDAGLDMLRHIASNRSLDPSVIEEARK